MDVSDEMASAPAAMGRTGTGSMDASSRPSKAAALATIQQWLDAGHSIDEAKPPEMQTMLHQAAAQGDVELVRLLLRRGAKPNVRNREGNSPLSFSCLGTAHGHSECSILLLQAQADELGPNAKQTLLSHHITAGQTNVVRFLLEDIAAEDLNSISSDNLPLPLHTADNLPLPLHTAAVLGRLDCMQLVLDSRADLDVPNSSGVTALFSACLGGQVDSATLLLDHGASVDHVEVHGCTPLYGAAKKGHAECLQLLLARKAAIEHTNNDGQSALYAACFGDNAACVKVLLDGGADAEQAGSSLHMALKAGYTSCVQLLLNHRVSPDVFSMAEELGTPADDLGFDCFIGFPLLSALRGGNVDCAALLLDHGAAINRATSNANPDASGITALYAAAYEGNVEFVRLLIDRKAAIDCVMAQGKSPLFAASHQGHANVVKLLCDNGASIKVGNAWPPLLSAASKDGHCDIVSILLEHGAEVDENGPNTSGQTPFFDACFFGQVKCAALLLNHKAAIDHRSDSGVTPMFAACKGADGVGQPACVKLLLDKKASIEMASCSDETPLYAACFHDTPTCAKLLLDARASVGTALDMARTRGSHKCLPLLEAAAEREMRTRQQAADAAMQALLAEEAEQQAAGKKARSKSKKKKASVQIAVVHVHQEELNTGAPGGNQPAPSSEVEALAVEPASEGASSSADDALRQAIGTGDLDAILSALSLHGLQASDAMATQARMARDKAKEKRRKRLSQQQRKAHAGAMSALATVEALPSSAGIDEIRFALSVTEKHVGGEIDQLDDAVSELRSRLTALELSVSPASAGEATTQCASGNKSACSSVTYLELETATAGFCGERRIGTGGFGDVFVGEPIASLLHADQIAVKRAKPGLDLSDLQKEIEILTHSNHPHLLQLLGHCLEAACLIFPLMKGGSLQSRLDLEPSDLQYLRRMGHFAEGPVKPLTWRQKIKIVLQAVDALHYLHTKVEGCTWHRDFKPANILLDEHLEAYLGDTGFAKAAQRSGDRSGATTSVWGGAGSLGYCEDALRPADAQTEGFAVGVTLLVVLTGHDAVDIEQTCEETNDNTEFEMIPAEQLARSSAGWPMAVTDELRLLYLKLTHKRRNRRPLLPHVMQSLSALLSNQPQVHNHAQATLRSSTIAPGSVCMPGSQLSQQVRRMRPSGASLKQNVAEGFDSLMYRLEEIYRNRDGDAPPRGEFERRIRFWHQACSLPAEVHGWMQTLRKWRNASVHRDDGVWRRDGPCSADEASQLLSSLDAAVERLTTDR